eukprot:7311987-Alexandrium_andersonii.AAC.1
MPPLVRVHAPTRMRVHAHARDCALASAPAHARTGACTPAKENKPADAAGAHLSEFTCPWSGWLQDRR